MSDDDEVSNLLDELRQARAALERVVLWRYAPQVVELIAEAALKDIDYLLDDYDDDDLAEDLADE